MTDEKIFPIKLNKRNRLQLRAIAAYEDKSMAAVIRWLIEKRYLELLFSHQVSDVDFRGMKPEEESEEMNDEIQHTRSDPAM